MRAPSILSNAVFSHSRPDRQCVLNFKGPLQINGRFLRSGFGDRSRREGHALAGGANTRTTNEERSPKTKQKPAVYSQWTFNEVASLVPDSDPRSPVGTCALASRVVWSPRFLRALALWLLVSWPLSGSYRMVVGRRADLVLLSRSDLPLSSSRSRAGILRDGGRNSPCTGSSTRRCTKKSI